MTSDTPGKTNKATHKIRTIGNPPIRKKPYRIPHAYREKVLDELEGMERDGIIEKLESEWASPLVVVTKKDGGIRLCVDYRKLNQVTKFDAYSMPRVEELLDEIGNAQFITTLDLAKGYWQVRVRQDHLTHLINVFQRLEDAHLTVRMKTCVFRAEDGVYLRYRIGQGGVRPEESRIQAILDITQPKTKKDVRVFLGMTGKYKRFVRDYAIITEPLTELIKKNSPEDVQGDVRTELAFQKLKQMLVSTPLMQNPDFTRTFVLQTDASGTGVGAVLSQGEDGDRPVAYFSRKLCSGKRHTPL